MIECSRDLEVIMMLFVHDLNSMLCSNVMTGVFRILWEKWNLLLNKIFVSKHNGKLDQIMIFPELKAVGYTVHLRFTGPLTDLKIPG